MGTFIAFLRDDRGNTTVEYALTFALFGIFAVIGLLHFQYNSGQALINTRARMTCAAISLHSTVAATVDASGNITCN